MKKRTPDVYFACGCLWKTEADAKQAVTLLKAERARVRRMVNRNKQTAKCRPMGFERTDGYLMACDDILAKLKEGR